MIQPALAQLVPAPVLGVCVWGGLASLICSLWVAIREAVTQLKKLHQVPCGRCVYFTGSYHLKCAVNPTNAFTEVAIGCRDFMPACSQLCSQKCPHYSSEPHKNDSSI